MSTPWRKGLRQCIPLAFRLDGQWPIRQYAVMFVITDYFAPVLPWRRWRVKRRPHHG